MLRKILCLILVVPLFGCASISVPNYIKDKHPYDRKVYGDYNTVLQKTSEALEDLGWQIEGTSDPIIYEGSIGGGNQIRDNIFVYTQTKQIPWILGTTYKKVNVHVRSLDDTTTEVEVRFIRVTSTFLLKFYGYRADRLANKILDKIEEKLK